MNTAKIYKSHLNTIGRNLEIETLEDLKKDSERVIKFITEATEKFEEGEKRNQARRIRYSAIFWALHGDAFLTQPDNPYRKAFHNSDPLEGADGSPWKKLKEFKEQQAELQKNYSLKD